MSDRTKKKAKKKRTPKPLKSKENLVDFDSWFWLKMNKGLVRPEQKQELMVFFKEKGLQDKEEKSRYEETLQLY